MIDDAKEEQSFRNIANEEVTVDIVKDEIEDVTEEAVEELKAPSRKLRLAVAGCAHGEMDKIYEVLAEIEKEKGYKFDLLICCGDYQSVRNYGDLHHMHVSEKYRSLQTFYKYYSGEKEAPILTIFVGGNHEASGYLSELPNGGWVAPKIYYMGFANVIRFAGLRIAGLSGIFNGKEFNRGHYERPPYSDRSEVISSYHVRNTDVWRLKQLRPADDDYTSVSFHCFPALYVHIFSFKNPIDIMVTHDWPAGIVDYGDKQLLLRIKPFFYADIESGKLGNPSTMQLLFVSFFIIT
ncbi:Ser/Thr phosphatase family protein, partial [Teladorsagia circumcincta]